jgi:hypothetical protein
LKASFIVASQFRTQKPTVIFGLLVDVCSF